MRVSKVKTSSYSVEAYASCACNMALCSCSITGCLCACQTGNPAQSDKTAAHNAVNSSRRSSMTYSSGNSSVG